MTNALVIGFGGMGCRHAQSLMNSSAFDKIYILEPNENVFHKNWNLIGAQENSKIIRIHSMDNIKVEIEFIVIATLADIRFKYFVECFKLDPKYILMEKIIFQSKEEFSQAISLVKNHKAQVYGNLPNRYFENYIQIKKEGLEIEKIKVTGPDFGLLCNSVHYIDLTQYLTGDVLVSHVSSMGWSEALNKRGVNFIEGEGTLVFTTKRGVLLEIVSDSKIYTDVVVEINTKHKTFRFNENKGLGSEISGSGAIQAEYSPVFASVLTSQAYADMMRGKCLFPNLEELRSSHCALFDSVKSLTDVYTDRLPIT